MIVYLFNFNIPSHFNSFLIYIMKNLNQIKLLRQNFVNGYYIDGRLYIIDHHHHNGSIHSLWPEPKVIKSQIK